MDLNKKIFQQIYLKVFKFLLNYLNLEFNIKVENINDLEVRLKRESEIKCLYEFSNYENYFKYNNFEKVEYYNEKRLLLIKYLLIQISFIFNFFYKKQKIKLIGFSLKNLEEWRKSSYFKDIDPLVNFAYSFSTYCNLNCRYCYEKNNPISYNEYKGILTLKEFRTRIKYFDRKNYKGLPIRISKYGEPFINKNIFNILYEYRKSGFKNEVITLTTNLTLINKEIIEKLENLKPIVLVISINSLNNKNRFFLLGDKQKNSANNIKNNLNYIRLKKIPFIASFIYFYDNNFEEFCKELQYVDSFNPLYIRITYESYNKYNCKNNHKKINFNYTKMKAITEKLKKFSRKLKSSLVFNPYFESFYSPNIDIVIPESPLYRAGVTKYCIINKINNIEIKNKNFLKQILKEFSLKKENFEIEFIKDNKIYNSYVDFSNYSFPYIPQLYDSIYLSAGAIIINGLKLKYFRTIKQIYEKNKNKKIIVLVSRMVFPYVKSILFRIYPELLYSKNIKFKIIKHSFWGGNIFIGDLYTVYDYIEFLKNINYKPDLLIIPKTHFDLFGYDIRGQSIKDVESIMGVKTILLDVLRIN